MPRPIARFGILSLFLAFLAVPFCSAEDSPTGPAGFELKSGQRVLSVRAQTPDEAYGYLVRVLADMEFFRANGYDVALPDHPAFAADAKPPGEPGVFATAVYDAADFKTALGVLAADREILQGALEWFAKTVDIEGFRQFDQYDVTLTLYGPGGSFDPETGTIVLFTTPDGRFKGGGGTHPIVHEMMHLAVEEGLVQRFDLSHWEKERLVDLLVQREFAEPLPDYKLQSSGDTALDPYLAGVPLADVAEALGHYHSESRKK